MSKGSLFIILAAVCFGAAACRGNDYDYLAAPSGEVLRIELAVTPEERAAGLSGRENLSPDAGMLFIYAAPRQAIFWMKGMNFPLDMVFLHADLSVAEVVPAAAPCLAEECPRIISLSNKIQYVLELPAGRAIDLGMTPGTRVRWPN